MEKKAQLKKQMENKTVLVWKMGVASALSWEIAKLAGSDHPYLAPLSVILCLQTTINKSILFSYHRITGTVIGIIVVVLLEEYLKVNTWTLGGLIILGCFITKWLKRDESAIHQAALAILLVFVLGDKSGDYPIDRFRDTLIGAIIAVILQMIVHPPNYTKQAVKSCSEASATLYKLFSEMAEWIQNGLGKQRGNQIQTELQQAGQELQLLNDVMKDANESLKYNPLAKKGNKVLQDCKLKINLFSEGHAYLTNMVEKFSAWSEDGTVTKVDQTIWAEQLKTLGPVFQVKENLKQVPALNIMIPEEVKQHQYSLALYNDTKLLIKKLGKLPAQAFLKDE